MILGRKYKILFYLIFIQMACQQHLTKELGINEFVKDLKEKSQTEYIFTSNSDSFHYKLQFVPQAALFLNHFNNHPTQVQLDSFNKHKSDLVSFVLKIQPNSAYKYGGMKSYETFICNNPDKMKYLTESLLENVKLINGSDSLSPVFSHFERSFGLKPELTIHLAFDANHDWSNNIEIKFLNRLTKICQITKFEIPKETISFNPPIKL